MRALSAQVRRALCKIWEGREAGLLTPRLDAAGSALVRELASVGAAVRLAVAGGVDRDSAPPMPYTFCCAEHAPGGDFESLLTHPPPAMATWFDAVDPGGDVRLLGTTFTRVAEVCGRPVHGWRRPEWAAWEDKTRIDERLRRIGVPAPRSAVLPASSREVRDRCVRLDGGFGIVLAAGAAGEKGAASRLRWIRDLDGLDAALAWARETSAEVRVAEFKRGIPCSILGMVLAQGVAVFDPIEIVTLKDHVTGRFVFCGSSTWWRAERGAHEMIRRCARSAGQALAESAGYRGIFSLDGIVAAEGFLATEVNARHASGLGLGAAWPEFPVRLLNRAVQQRDESLLNLSPSHLERCFVEAIAGQPSWSVRVPRAATPADLAEPASVAAEGIHMRCRTRPDSVEVVDPGPLEIGDAIGPRVAALARALGGGRLTSFDAEPPPSCLAAPRGELRPLDCQS